MQRFLLLFVIAGYPSAAAVAQISPEPADTIRVYQMPDQIVNGRMKWDNDTVRYHYNQMKYYVTTVLPYVNAATGLFNDMNAKLSDDGLKGKARRHYISAKEDEMRDQFESKIKGLNETQGVLLIKLIARQTGLNICHSISEFKGGIAAIKWQTWARLHGFNLNKKYDPANEPDLERIMRGLGYPLPAFYVQRN